METQLQACNSLCKTWLHFLSVSGLVTIIFLYHSYTILKRYQENTVLESKVTFRNSSLPLPVIVLKYSRYRETFPNGTATQSRLRNVSFTYADIRKMWPLRTTRPNSYEHGFIITGHFDGSDFVEYCGLDEDEEGDNNCDYIYMRISDFETDYPGTSSAIAVPEYSLLPCENLMVTVALQHDILRDREASRCRDDYSALIRNFIKPTLGPQDLFNPILGPDLPYDQLTCERLCIAAYWLPKCKCYVHYMSYRYAGSPANISVCPKVSNNDDGNCTQWFAEDATPPEYLAACECYAKCNEQRFSTLNEQRQRYSPGTMFCPSVQKSMVRVHIIHADYSYVVIAEHESYPYEEMINELAGVVSLYFGFSVVSLAMYVSKSLYRVAFGKKLWDIRD